MAERVVIETRLVDSNVLAVPRPPLGEGEAELVVRTTRAQFGEHEVIRLRCDLLNIAKETLRDDAGMHGHSASGLQFLI